MRLARHTCQIQHTDAQQRQHERNQDDHQQQDQDAQGCRCGKPAAKLKPIRKRQTAHFFDDGTRLRRPGLSQRPLLSLTAEGSTPVPWSVPGIITQIGRLSQKNRAIRHTWLVAAVLAITWALCLTPLLGHALREDEALYASWAMAMRHGNPWLAGLPIDKPPLYLWLLAIWQSWLGETVPAMRLLNASITAFNVVLVYALGRQLADRRTGLLAAAVFAASPFTILFAPTLYTDPLLILWFLAACLAATRGRWTGLGLCLGLALITKQHGLLLAPLPLLLALPHLRPLAGRSRSAALARLALGLVLPVAVACGWDALRGSQSLTGGPPNIWQQSTISYGGLALAAPATWPARVRGWLALGQYITGFLPATFMVALSAVVLLTGTQRVLSRRADRSAGVHHQGWRLIVAFGLSYLVVHTVVGFQVWERYLLPLVPLAALTAGWGWSRLTPRAGVVMLLVLACCLLPPALVATRSGYPIGGDHGTYDGIDVAAATIRQVLPDNKWGVLYHHSLGWHWRYYLAGTQFQQVYYATPADLAADAAGPAGYVRILAVPAGEDVIPVQAALARYDRQLHLHFTIRRDDGSPAFYVYAVEPVTAAWPAPIPATAHGPQEVP